VHERIGLQYDVQVDVLTLHVVRSDVDTVSNKTTQKCKLPAVGLSLSLEAC